MKFTEAYDKSYVGERGHIIKIGCGAQAERIFDKIKAAEDAGVRFAGGDERRRYRGCSGTFAASVDNTLCLVGVLILGKISDVDSAFRVAGKELGMSHEQADRMDDGFGARGDPSGWEWKLGALFRELLEQVPQGPMRNKVVYL